MLERLFSPDHAVSRLITPFLARVQNAQKCKKMQNQFLSIVILANFKSPQTVIKHCFERPFGLGSGPISKW